MKTCCLALLFLFVSSAAPSLAQEQETRNCGAPAALADGWAIASPAEVALDGETLCGLDGFLAQWSQANIHAVLIARHGRLVMERYFKGADQHWGTPIGTVQFAANVKHDLRSISKNVTSLLVGIALSEGKFPPLDSSVFDQFPQFASLRTPDNTRITLRHLLTMSAGLAWDESLPYNNPANSEIRMIAAPDPVRYVLQQAVVSPPGTVFNYNGGGTTVLGAVLEKTTGQRLEDYARDKLFRPLSIADFEWVRLPTSGKASAASGLRLRPRDTAKLGQLLVTDGVWQGRQVLPRGWIAESTMPRMSAAGIHYGYQWWIGQTRMRGREYTWTAGVGYGGQRLFALPELGLVVVVNAGHYQSILQDAIPIAIFTRIALPSVRN